MEPPPPKLDYYGLEPPSLDQTLRNQLVRDGKRKNCKLMDEVFSKRACSPPSSSSVEKVGGYGRQVAEQVEVELLSRRQQEEEDLRLALQLQKELNDEEKRRSTDRRKGSADAYLLRRGGKLEESPSGRTPRRTGSSSATTSSTVSSPSFSTKQTTLTEMFSSLTK